jgi:protocatechuate 3,4-dioxygenase beta subunit
MRLVASIASILLFATAASAQLPGMPSREAAPQKTGTAQLSGRVLDAETGKPLRRAVVRAFGAELREGRSASTDAQGRWTIRSLPAGKYTISVTKGGYVNLNYGQRRPFEAGQQVDLAAGQTLEKLDIALPRGGVITGRIQDEFGEAFAGIRVVPMRQRYFNGQRRLVAVGTGDITDDIGQYRLHGLTPGEYYVSATNSAINFDVSEDKMGYAPTYFPGTAMLTDAQRVAVAVGQETPNVNFDLAPTRVATVSGLATNAEGKPLANSVIMMTSPLLFAGVATISPAMVRPDGTFTISNVAPGEYRLETFSMGDLQQFTASAGQASLSEAASLQITVTGEDVSGLTLVSAPTASVKGRIVFEGDAAPKVPSGAVMILAMAPVQTSIMPGSLGRVQEDWTFQIKGLTEKRLIRANAPSGWFLKAVTVNGTDLTDTGIEFKPGDDVSGVDVVLTRQMGSLAGTATVDGKAVSDYVVVAFAADRAKWGTGTRFVRSSRPDQSGKFELKGLPGEDYFVVALEYLEPGEEGDPEVQERLRAQATRVTVADGEAKTVTLKVR